MTQRADGPSTTSGATCALCQRRSPLIAASLGVCADCIRCRTDDALPRVLDAHARARSPFHLPAQPPRHPAGIPCTLCANDCVIGVGETGFCGLRENVDGHLHSLATPHIALLYAYPDPHVTNCCAAWCCPAGTGVGYPTYAHRPGPEIGFSNLAVFFYGCNFHCLFCQNASHKELSPHHRTTLTAFTATVQEAHPVSCICYFGGSPEPQLPFALNASRRLREADPRRLLRFCFEWNGGGHPRLVRRAAELAYESGGNLKFDLKCWTPALSLALSGVSNARSYANFPLVADEFGAARRDVPLLAATTLLVPGYVDAAEVAAIAQFIAAITPDLPYSLLLFHPAYQMQDLPVTPYDQVVRCYQAAKRHLHHVHVGNLNLLDAGAKNAFQRHPNA